MADLLENPIITGDSVDTITIPRRGRYLLSIGFGDIADPSDAASEDFEDAYLGVKLGGNDIEDQDGTSLVTVLSGVQFLIDLPLGAVLQVTTQNTTTACRITVQCKLVEAYNG